MALMDYRIQLLDAKSVAGASSATVVDYTVDLGAANPNVGRGEPVYLHARVGTAVSGNTTTSTFALYLQHSHSNVAASFVNLVNMNLKGGSSMTGSLLTAGKLIYSAALPPACRRYIRCVGTIAGATVAGGTIDAWLDIGSLPTAME